MTVGNFGGRSSGNPYGGGYGSAGEVVDMVEEGYQINQKWLPSTTVLSRRVS